MDQYIIYTKTATTQYQVWTDGTTLFRTGIRDNLIQYDKTLTSLGFTGTENVDWINTGGEGNLITGATAREGVRDENWVIDIELTALGFLGAENTDWENVSQIDNN